MIKASVKRVIPPKLYREIVKRRYRLRPSPLDPWRRLAPVSPDNNARGRSVDRFYIESFLAANAPSITGATLEITDDTYTKYYGCNVTRSDVLNDPRSGVTTGIVGDIRRPETLAADSYDCIIVTQMLQFVYDTLLAINAIHAALKPGGIALITVPGIAQLDRYDDSLWGDFHRWMPRGFRSLMAQSNFTTFTIQSFGNVLAATAFLYNMAIDDLTVAERLHNDDDYPLIVGCVAAK